MAPAGHREAEDDDEQQQQQRLRRRAEEYQMQLFGTHARNSAVAIEQKLESIITSQLKKLYETLVNKYQPVDKEKAILESDLRHLRRRYRKNMGPAVKSIENAVNRIIHVPDNILLEEDKCQAVQYTDEEYTELQQRLESLQKNAKRASILNAALNEELDPLNNLEPLAELARRLCASVDKGLAAKKISGRTVRAIEQVGELRACFREFRAATRREACNPRVDDELEEVGFLDE